MQSKFWAGGVSESETESEESVHEAVEAKRPLPGVNRVLLESSSDEEDHRVVRSLKDRRWNSMLEVIKQLNNHMKISDYSSLNKDYDNLMKLVAKANQVIDQEGYPKFLIRSLMEIDSYIESKIKDKESFKKLSKARASSLNTLRAKIRKASDGWVELVERCRSHPEEFETSDESDGSESDSDSEDEGVSEEEEEEEEDEEEDEEEEAEEGEEEEQVKVGKGKAKDVSAALMDYESENESEWSAGDVVPVSADENEHGVSVMDIWGIKTKKKLAAVKVSRKKLMKAPKGRKGKDTEKVEVAAVTKSMDDLFDTTEVTGEVIRNRIQMVMGKRGRRGVDRLDQTNILKKIAEVSKMVGEQSYVEVLAQLVTAELDTSTGSNSINSMETWLDSYKTIAQILDILESNPAYHLVDMTVTEDTGERPEQNVDKISTTIIAAFLERLDDELTKSLQLKDVYSDAYKSRLGHTIDIVALLGRAYDFVLSKNDVEHSPLIALRILDHLYNKQDALAIKTWELVKKKVPTKLKFLPEGAIKPSEIIDLLFRCITKHGEHREKVHALLHLAYNKSLHDYYYEACDLLQIPNMHELCLQLDVQTQILYNRNLVQLGLCAFRRGLIKDAHTYLADICAQNRHKELLAQAVSMVKNQEKTPEQERAERKRLLPYHMHINLDLVEGVHNICAMLLEIPHRAMNQTGSEYPISRQFSRMLELYDSQPFQGPPENQRETIMAATKALQKGDWKECCRHVFALNIWDKFVYAETVKDILLNCIKREAMRTYIFSYGYLYDSFSTSQLSLMFALSENQVHSIVSKMMVNEEIHASWDETSQRIMISRVEASKLQQLAVTVSENISIAVEQNELTLNMKNPKFVLTHDRRSPFQQFGDRYHGWGNRGPTEASAAHSGAVARNRGHFRATKRIAGNTHRNRRENQNNTTMKWNIPSDISGGVAFRPVALGY